MTSPRTWLDVLRAPAFLINLDRRPERLKSSLEKIQAAGFTDVRRLAGTDGEDSRALAAAWATFGDPAFDPDDKEFAARPGKQGCFVSHLRVWQQMVDEAIPYAILFEDDVHFHRHWSVLAPIYFSLTPPDYDLVYMGCSVYGRMGMIQRAPVYCMHALLVTLDGARAIIDSLLSSDRGVRSLDTMLNAQQEADCALDEPCPFNWYAWDGRPFPDPRGRVYPDWIHYNCGLVFQDRSFASDLRVVQGNLANEEP